jgi:ketol-acid reductoisomerase
MAEEIKTILADLYLKHMDDIESGEFSRVMMEDWANDDKNLLTWRENFAKCAFENAPSSDAKISEQEYFDKGTLLVAFVKAGIELAFETMTKSGIYPESAYYESLHELPLIANTIARRRLYEMNVVISDTAEYGNYLFANAAIPMLKDFMSNVKLDVFGETLGGDNGVDNVELIHVNDAIRNHPIEIVGRKLRAYMSDMKKISVGNN